MHPNLGCMVYSTTAGGVGGRRCGPCHEGPGISCQGCYLQQRLLSRRVNRPCFKREKKTKWRRVKRTWLRWADHQGARGELCLNQEWQWDKREAGDGVSPGWRRGMRNLKHLPKVSGAPLQHSCLENPMDGGAW